MLKTLVKYLLILWGAACPFAAFAVGSFADFRQIALRPDAQKDIPSFLRAVKSSAQFRSLFSNYTLARGSISLQEADPKLPRVLMFGDDARLIVTFNASNEMRGGYALETVEYDPSRRRLFFREILFKNEFPAKLAGKLKVKSLKDADSEVLENELGLSRKDIDHEDEHVAITKANPNKCMQCHRTNDNFPEVARYIWDAYPIWRNFYGEQDDLINLDSPPHRQAFRVFQAASETHPRYRLLDSKAFGFNERAYYTQRPNLRLTKLIAINQAEVYAELLGPSVSPARIKEYINRNLCKKKEFTIIDVSPIPVSLGLDKTEDYRYSLGSGDLLKSHTARNYFLNMIEFVLVRDYLRSKEDTSAWLDDVIRTNIQFAMKAKTESEFSSLYGIDDNFVRLFASYYAVDVSPLSSKLESWCYRPN